MEFPKFWQWMSKKKKPEPIQSQRLHREVISQMAEEAEMFIVDGVIGNRITMNNTDLLNCLDISSSVVLRLLLAMNDVDHEQAVAYIKDSSDQIRQRLSKDMN